MTEKSNTPAEHKDCWQTPPEIFNALNAEFNFKLDAAASEENALCEQFIAAEQNTLDTPWCDYLQKGYVWLNPPYSNPRPFVKKAAEENSKHFIGCVMLLPADTSVGWFKEAIKTASEVRFITGGRLSFVSAEDGKPKGGNSKGSMLIVWHPWPRTSLHLHTVDLGELVFFGKNSLESAA